MSIAYDVLTAAVTGVLVGNEFAVGRFIHPELRRLPDSAPTIAASLGKGDCDFIFCRKSGSDQ